ncbi:MAG TPA: hypothetical protein VKR06_02505 [Ktedonosporobacter sp.]|nr:hypothetical protein [Ktedonosporobacter sp.]
MITSVQSRASTDDGRTGLPAIDIEEMLQRYDPYIIAQVKELVRQNPHIAHPAVLDLEIDELVQRVRIKFWHVLSSRGVEYSRAYIKRIVHSEFIDMVRSKKPLRTLPLPVDEEGELYQGAMLVTLSTGMSDPADEVEEQSAVTRCMDEVVDAVLQLAPRQQYAMVCSLRERVDDVQPFEHAFHARNVDISGLQWPVKKREKQLLQSSISAARQNIARCLAEPSLLKKAIGRLKKNAAPSLAL